jgi:hypothetical protein
MQNAKLQDLTPILMKRIFDCTAVLAALFLFGLPMLHALIKSIK